LTYGVGSEQMTSTVSVLGSGAVEGDMLRRYWAQSKLGDLLPLQKQHREEIVDLGKEHALVTPFTSLLVLDSLEQYVEHRVTPPKSWPELRQQYGERMEKIEVAKKKTRADKLAKVVPMWKTFCTWYGEEFKYPRDFRYSAKPEKKMAEDASVSNGIALGGRAAPATPEAPPSAAPMRTERSRSDRNVAAAESLDPQGRDEAVADLADAGGVGVVDGKERRRIQPGVVLTPWDPKTPYLAELKKAKEGTAFARYLQLRSEKDYASSPAFYLDCARFFHELGEAAVALQVLSNLAELELENPQLLRVLAHRLEQIGERGMAIQVFEQVLEMRGEEPQSYRDLALVLIARAEDGRKEERIRADLERAIALLTEVVMRHWERFEEIEIMALVEINRILPAAYDAGLTDIPLDERLIKPIDCDMRITMTWDADNTDIDLHVVEPSGEEAYYGHNRTTIGGRVSRDFTQGYGPEDYMLRKAMNGTYTVKAKYYGSQSVKLLCGVTVQVNIYTHYGRPEQQCKSMTLRLVEKKDMITIGELEF
jgi:tetratricopeptide (TPR) repeat protein